MTAPPKGITVTPPIEDNELRDAVYNYYRGLVGAAGDVHHATVCNGMELVSHLIGNGNLSRV